LTFTSLVLVVVLGLGAGSSPAAPSACPTSNPPNELVLVGGSGQTAQLGRQFASPLQVALANTNGCPLTGNLAGENVTFDAPAAGPSGIFSDSGSREVVVGTNAEGVATAPTLTANFTAGGYTVDAHADVGVVALNLTNTANGLAASVLPTGGTPQAAAVNSRFGQPLQARVVDANGNPVQGATVSFTIVPGSTGAGASFLGSGQATTDSNGLATSPPLQANGKAGRFSAVASTDGVAAVATYTLDNQAADYTLSAVGAPMQTAAVNSRFGQTLQARVTDTDGNPVQGATVSFTIVPGSTGAGASFVGSGQATTDSNGIATSPPLQANGSPGLFTAVASTDGATAVVTYTLENQAAAYTLGAAGSMTQTTAVNSRFGQPLEARVTDTDGNPVQGATVNFTIVPGPTSAAASFLGSGQATTDSNGIATSPPLQANGSPGRFTAVASTDGATAVLTYSLDNRAAADTLKAVGASSQSATIDSRYPRPLRVRLLGPDGQPLEGAGITFTLGAAAGGGGGGAAGATFAGGAAAATAVTNANGLAASPAILANETPGRFTATVTVTGSATSLTYKLSNLAARLDAGDAVRSATVGHRYERTLTVHVRGAGGAPVAGVSVTFAIGKAANNAGASFPDGTTQATATTNSAGLASAPAITADSVTGTFKATATVSGSKPTTYTLRNRPGPPAAIATGAADGISATTGSRLPIPLAVTVTDSDGNPVAGAVVRFTAPGSGPGGRFTIGAHGSKRAVDVRTNANGIAIAPPFTANHTAGGYSVDVRAGTAHAAFAMVNRA
jgi:adhesin/invasin